MVVVDSNPDLAMCSQKSKTLKQTKCEIIISKSKGNVIHVHYFKLVAQRGTPTAVACSRPYCIRFHLLYKPYS